MKTKAFISYSRRDMDFVDRLVAGLEGSSIAASIDRTEIYSFEDWWKRIERLIAEADAVIFVLSPDAVASSICRREVDHALSLGKRFAPVVARSVAGEMDKVAPELAQLNFILFDSPHVFDDSLAKLVEALNTDIGWIREHTQFGLDAQGWATSGRPSGRLLRSPRLEEAERWIASRPPNAPTPTDEIRDFLLESRRGASRRRNILTGSLAAGLVVAVALAGVAFWQRGQAVEQRRIAVQQRTAAERNLAAAKATVDGLIFDIGQGLSGTAGMRVETIRNILGTVRQTVDKLLATAPDDRRLLRSRATMLQSFAKVYIAAGARTDALKAADESVAAFTSISEKSEFSLEGYLDVQTALNVRGDIRLQLGETDAAATDFAKALRSEVVLLKTFRRNSSLRENTIITIHYLGDVEQQRGHARAALQAYEKALEFARKWGAEDKSSAEAKSLVRTGLSRVAAAKRDVGDLNGAVSALEEIVEQDRAVAEAKPDDVGAQRNLSVDLGQAGGVKMQAGDNAGADAAMTEVVAIARRLAALDPSSEALRGDLALTLANLGTAKMAAADKEGAYSVLDESVAIRRSILTRDPGNPEAQRELARTLEKLAQAKLTFEDAKEALALSIEILSQARKRSAAAPNDVDAQRDVAGYLVELGSAKLKLGDKDGFSAAFRESTDITRRIAARDPDNTASQRDLYSSLVEAGTTMVEAKMPHDALAFYREAAAVTAARLAKDPKNEEAAKNRAYLRERISEVERMAQPADPPKSSVVDTPR